MPMAAISVSGASNVASNATVWLGWNSGYSTTSATTISVTDSTWLAWNTAFTNGTGATLSTSTVGFTTQQWVGWNTAYEETAEQKAERERVAAETRQRIDEQRRARAAANARAEELLLSLLTDEQARTYRERGWFEVRGSRGGRWRIRNRGQSGNVDLMPEIGEEREASYCAHPPTGLPDADAYVAQMLHLVTDEDGFKRTANVHYRRPQRTRGAA